jgi:nucleoside 2-deoxyribosyltransferase
MPFSKELEDVYIYGIRKSVNTIRFKCLRADELEFTGSIIDEIIDNVKRCRAVVAEISDENPNVFYEVGWAHALGKPTILVARGAADLPFDVRHINTITYQSIHELEERLTARLRALPSDDAAA